MRRLTAALIVLMVAATLGACASAAPDEGATPVPTTVGAPAAAAAKAGETPDPNGDVLSPLPGGAGVAFPTDAASIPTVVLDNLNAKKPMLIFWYDPTTNVSKEQRTEIDSVMETYAGSIALFSFDYTTGLPSGTGAAALPPEIDKAERMTGLLGVSTTPYIVFVNSAGQITFRFSGFADRSLIKREVMTATK